MKKMSVFWGIVLILLGVLLILAQQKVIRLSFSVLWPGAMIVLALMFHIQAFFERPHNPGLLVPGGILLVYGGLFMSCAIAGWDVMSTMWPLFILGPALGLAELRLFSRGREGSWIPVIILTIVGGFFLAQQLADLSRAVILALILIVIGTLMIINQFRKSGAAGKSADRDQKSE